MSSKKNRLSLEESAKWIRTIKPRWRCGHSVDPSLKARLHVSEWKRLRTFSTGRCATCEAARAAARKIREAAELYPGEAADEAMIESYEAAERAKTPAQRRMEREEEVRLQHEVRGRDSHKSDYITLSTVKKTYEFTDREVDLLLGAPDKLSANPHYRSNSQMKLYLRERVEQVRGTPAYAEARARGAKRRAQAEQKALLLKKEAAQAVPGSLERAAMLEEAEVRLPCVDRCKAGT